MTVTSTTAATETAIERAARIAAAAKATEEFLAALAAARVALGVLRVTDLLDEAGWLPEEDHSDCREPIDGDALDRAARLVHEAHDQFSWTLCSEPACLALREV
jgi:hypothetical protein